MFSTETRFRENLKSAIKDHRFKLECIIYDLEEVCIFLVIVIAEIINADEDMGPCHSGMYI